jgi:F0F1-type ATP synthase membrane subunit b/b'
MQQEIVRHIQTIREQAKQLQEEAEKVLEKAKMEVEKKIDRSKMKRTAGRNAQSP